MNRHRHARRGFAIAVVMMIFTVVSLLVAAMLYRSSARTALAARQLANYQAHHDTQGLKTITLRWLRTPEAQRDIRSVANTGMPVFSVSLATGATVTLRVYDGQGTLLADPVSARRGPQRDRLIEALGYLPPDSDHLLRTIGPVKVGILSAPDEVLRAIALGDQGLFNLLTAIREDPPESDTDIARILNMFGLESLDQRAPILELLTLNTNLWAIEAEVQRDGFTTERYEVMAELQGNLPTVHRVQRIELPEDRERMAW